MRVGSFNFNQYLEKLNEEAEAKEGLIIPEENKKAYAWLKSEFQKGKTEVKVEMSSAKFEPGYSFAGAKDFKPEVTGGEKTSTSVPNIAFHEIKDVKEKGTSGTSTTKPAEPKKTNSPSKPAEPKKEESKKTEVKKPEPKKEEKKDDKKEAPKKEEKKEEPKKEENKERKTNESLNEGLFDWIKKGIGNKIIDDLVNAFAQNYILIQNELLAAQYGDLIKQNLLGGVKGDDFFKKYQKQIDKNNINNLTKQLDTLKKTLTPIDKGDKSGKFYLTRADGKTVTLSPRMKAYLDSKRNQIELQIAQQEKQILDKLSTGKDITPDMAKNLKDTSNMLTQKIKDTSNAYQQSDKLFKESKPTTADTTDTTKQSTQTTNQSANKQPAKTTL